MRRLVALATAFLLLVVAACGGDSGDPGTDNATPPETNETDMTQPAQEDAGSDPTTPPAEDDGGAGSDETSDAEGSGPSTATVTIGDETYNFSTEGAVAAQCLTDMFGIFSVQLPMVDDNGALADGSVGIIALHEDTNPEEVGEVNAVEVDAGDETWVADEADELFDTSDQLEPGMGQVDSVEIDGRTVRGTATFFRQLSVVAGDEVETMTGTFEAMCGEERTS